MNKEVNQVSNNKFTKLKFFWWIMGAVVSTAILITIAVANPSAFESNLVVSSSNQQSNSSGGEGATSSISLIGIEVDVLPSRLTYNAVEVIETSGGMLRLVFSDYSVRYVSMNNSMIDATRLNTSTLGTSKVTLAYSFNGDTLFTSYNINIVAFVTKPISLSLDVTSADVLIDQLVNLKYIVEPSNANYSNVVWTSSNPLVATVDNNGLVTAKNIGEVVITATLDNNLTASARLNFKNPPGIDNNQGAANQEFVYSFNPDDYPDYIPINSGDDLMMIGLAGETYTFAANTPFAIEFNDTPGLSGNYVLIREIDLSNFDNSDYNWSEDTNSSNSIIPIGFEDVSGFTGIFDGRLETIKNLKLDLIGGVSYIGLFSFIDGGTVKNLIIENALIQSDLWIDNVGILAGTVRPDSLIKDVHVEGEIKNGDFNVGGLVGEFSYQDGDFSSTPFIFTKDSQGQFNYVNELGSSLPKYLDNNDWAILNGDKIALQNDNSYHINITAEYNEIVYMDEVNLLVFDHDPNYQLVNTSLFSKQNVPNEDFILVPNNLNTIISAFDQFGTDVTLALSGKDDGLWTSFGTVETDYLNEITINLGDQSNSSKIILVYSGVNDNQLNSQHSVTTLKVLDNSGNWQDALNYDPDFSKNNISRPTPTPRLYYFDLTTVFNNLNNTNEFKIRIGFNQRSLDYVAIANEMNTDYSLTTLNPNIAELGYRGFSKITLPSSTNPYKVFDYHQITSRPHDVYGHQSGNFTKYGDVSILLSEKDDMLAVLRYGDEVELKFNHSEIESGVKRSLVLAGSIWFKHANKETGSSVEPMPFTEMNNYPYYTNSYPSALEIYKSEWNTRFIAPKSNLQTPQMFQSLNFIQLFNGQSSYGIYDSTADVSVEGTENVGGLIGIAYGPQGNGEFAIVSNSSSSGTVKGIRYIGGLIGFAYDLSIENSNSDVFLGPRVNLIDNGHFGDAYSNSTYSSFGGLVGYAASGGNSQDMTINNSYFDGVIDFTLVLPVGYSNYFDIARVGGLVGYAYDFVYINQSYATQTNNLNNIIFDITGGNFDNSGSIGIVNVGGLIGRAEDYVFLDIGVNQIPGIRRGTKSSESIFNDIAGSPYDLEDNYIYYYDISTYQLYIYDGEIFTLAEQPSNDDEENYHSYSNMNIYINVLNTGPVDIGNVGGLFGRSYNDTFIDRALAKGRIAINVSTEKSSGNTSVEGEEGYDPNADQSEVEIYRIGGLIGEFESDGTSSNIIYNSSSYVDIEINVTTEGDNSYVSVDQIAGYIGRIDSDTRDAFILNGRSSGLLEIDAETSGKLTYIRLEDLGGFIGQALADNEEIYIYGSSTLFEIKTNSLVDLLSENRSLNFSRVGGFIGYSNGDSDNFVNIYGSNANSKINIDSESNNGKLSVNIFEVGGFIGRSRFANIIENLVISEIDINIFSKLANNTDQGGYNPFIEISSIGGFIGKIDRDHDIDIISVDTNIKIITITDEVNGFSNEAIFINNISGLIGALLQESNVEVNYELNNFELAGEVLIEAYTNADDKIKIFTIGSLVGYTQLGDDYLEITRTQLENIFLDVNSTSVVNSFDIEIKVSSSEDINFIFEINKFVGRNFDPPFLLTGVTDAEPDNVFLSKNYSQNYSLS